MLQLNGLVSQSKWMRLKSLNYGITHIKQSTIEASFLNRNMLIIGMAIIKKFKNDKCWRWCGEEGAR